MTIVCQNCSTRLQLDDDKMPSGSFSVRCPKCNKTVNSTPANRLSEQSALAVGGSPSTEHPRYEQPTAPAYRLSNVNRVKEIPAEDDAIRRLLDLLTKGTASGLPISGSRSAWNQREALVCTSPQYREAIASGLSQNNFQVFVAEDTRQAVETMRANKMDLVLLEPQFDSTEQGAAFVVREINVLRPIQRRRLFFVLLSPSMRTMDAHAAFLNNVNAIVNLSEVGELPQILEIALREFNELYKDLNQALTLSAL
jgi:predicted Zn finger-like uncharacterized protein